MKKYALELFLMQTLSYFQFQVFHWEHQLVDSDMI